MAAPQGPPRKGERRESEPPEAQLRRLQRDLKRALTGEERSLLALLRSRPEGRELLRLRDTEKARELLCRRLWAQRRRLDAKRPPPNWGGGRSGGAPPPRRAPREPPRDEGGALRGGLLRLRLRAEEAEWLAGLYRGLGAHLEEENRAARLQLRALEAELGGLRRELSTRPGGGRGGAQAKVRRARGARPQVKEMKEAAPAPPQESPEPEGEGPGEAPPSAPPTPPPEDPGCSPSPPRSPQVSPPISPHPPVLPPGAPPRCRGAVWQGVRGDIGVTAVAVGRLRAEVAALEARWQRLWHSGGGQRARAQQRAAELREELGRELRAQASTRRALAEVTRDLGTATTALQHLALRLRHLPMEEAAGGPPAEPPPEGPSALPLLLEQTRARLLALRGGLGGHPQAPRPPQAAPHQVEALLRRSRPHIEGAPPSSDEEEGADPPGDPPPSRAAIKRQSRLILESRRGGRGARGGRGGGRGT